MRPSSEPSPVASEVKLPRLGQGMEAGTITKWSQVSTIGNKTGCETKEAEEETAKSGSAKITREVAIANLDCDLYASSVQVLDHLLGRRLLPDGAVLLLDDYNCNRANPRFGMRRAMRQPGWSR